MTDADTPRVPEFRWAPVPQWGGAVYIKSNRGNWFELHAALAPVELPADAVKLGDVGTEMLGRLGAENMRDRYKAALESCEVVLAQCQAERDRLADELRNLRADIRAVLATKQPYIGWHRGQVLARLDREPGREEPGKPAEPAPAPREDEVFERLPDEGSLPQYRLREPGREEPTGECAPGKCKLGMCSGQSSDYGPCGGCCSCLGGCLEAEQPGREKPNDPRVFFPGDTVPAEVEVWTKDRAVYRWGADRQLLPYEGAMVEVLYPSPAKWQAIVDRARAARGHVVEHQPEEGR